MGLGLTPQVSSPEEIVRLAAWFLLRREYAPVDYSYYSSGALSETSATIPIDDTIPQNTEGAEWATLSHTPSAAAHILLVNVVCQMGHNNSGVLAIALFKDSDANALAVSATTTSGVNKMQGSVELWYKMVAGTTSPITFKVRFGSNAALATGINAANGSRYFGGVSSSSILILEMEA